MSLPPLLLAPILAPKPWGGRRLASLGRTLPDGVTVGESWDVADLAASGTVDDPVSRVVGGPLDGTSLHDLVARDRAALLGTAAPVDGRFPLLVKTLDAREQLSVQVHPPAAYVAEDPSVHLKTESWVVLDAEPEAELMLGLVDGVTLDDVRAGLGTPAVARLLGRVPARVGDVHHLPAGLVHALGAGVVVAEVQTPSDTTFRLYDWTEELGRAPRELHLAQGLRAIELGWEHNVAGPPAPPTGPTLVDNEHYRIDRHQLAAGAPLPATAGELQVVYVVTGEVAGDGLPQPVGRGSVALLPASCTATLTATTASTVLLVAAT